LNYDDWLSPRHGIAIVLKLQTLGAKTWDSSARRLKMQEFLFHLRHSKQQRQQQQQQQQQLHQQARIKLKPIPLKAKAAAATMPLPQRRAISGRSVPADPVDQSQGQQQHQQHTQQGLEQRVGTQPLESLPDQAR